MVTPSASLIVTVASRFCERQDISRSVFYKIRRRAREQGPVEATEPGSRRPLKSPRRTDSKVIEHALAVRAWLVGQGLDAGPLSVHAKMRRQGLTPPSRATLARAFAAAGVSKPEPRKWPRAANRRFVYPAPNCCWQIDAFAWSLADGTAVPIHQVIDDHTRLALATLVAEGETAKAAVKVVSSAPRSAFSGQFAIAQHTPAGTVFESMPEDNATPNCPRCHETHCARCRETEASTMS